MKRHISYAGKTILVIFAFLASSFLVLFLIYDTTNISDAYTCLTRQWDPADHENDFVITAIRTLPWQDNTNYVLVINPVNGPLKSCSIQGGEIRRRGITGRREFLGDIVSIDINKKEIVVNPGSLPSLSGTQPPKVGETAYVCFGCASSGGGGDGGGGGQYLKCVKAQGSQAGICQVSDTPPEPNEQCSAANTTCGTASVTTYCSGGTPNVCLSKTCYPGEVCVDDCSACPTQALPLGCTDIDGTDGPPYKPDCSTDAAKQSCSLCSQTGSGTTFGTGSGADFGQNFSFPLPPAQDFGTAIVSLFTWSLRVVGLAVFLMVFYAGFLWVTSAGNPTQVSKAKGYIKNAILGAILLFSAYVILNTINPDLVGGSGTLLPGLKDTTTP